MPPGTTTNASDTSTEMMQTREERSMRVRFADKSVDLLFERQMNADADAPGLGLRASQRRPLVGSLHQAGSAAGHDTAAHQRQFGRKITNGSVDPVVGRNPCGTKDCDSEFRPLRWAQTGEIVNNLP